MNHARIERIQFWILIIIFGGGLLWFMFMIRDGMQEMVQFNAEQNAYLQTVELGLPRWQMSCAAAVTKDGGDFAEVERKCSVNFPRAQGTSK